MTPKKPAKPVPILVEPPASDEVTYIVSKSAVLRGSKAHEFRDCHGLKAVGETIVITEEEMEKFGIQKCGYCQRRNYLGKRNQILKQALDIVFDQDTDPGDVEQLVAELALLKYVFEPMSKRQLRHWAEETGAEATWE